MGSRVCFQSRFMCWQTEEQLTLMERGGAVWESSLGLM